MKKIICISLAIITVLGVGIRLYMLNTKYPSPEKLEYSISEPVDYFNFDITVDSCDLLKKDELPENVQKEIETDNYSELHKDFRICLVNITIKNRNPFTNTLQAYNFMLQSDAWSNGIDQGLFTLFNPDGTLKLELKAGEEVKLSLPFSIIEDSFKKGKWKDIEQRHFDLLLSVYPQKRMIHVV